jgi:hypothetical protein
MRVHVECCAGHRAGEEPRVIEIDGSRLRVLSIARRWQDVSARCFQVRAEDGDRNILRHDERSNDWPVVEGPDS